MNPFMLLFFMFYNFVMPKFGIAFTIFYFLYANSKEHKFLELNTWFGLIISATLAIAFHFLISEKLFMITYKRFMSKVSNIEPFVAKTISVFALGLISIILGIFILDYIVLLRFF